MYFPRHVGGQFNHAEKTFGPQNNVSGVLAAMRTSTHVAPGMDE